MISYYSTFRNNYSRICCNFQISFNKNRTFPILYRYTKMRLRAGVGLGRRRIFGVFRARETCLVAAKKCKCCSPRPLGS